MVFAERKKLFHWRTVRRNKKEYSVCKQVIVATAVGLAAPAVSHAGPTGGEVVSGSGTINQSGNTTDILQATNRLDINWQTFSTNVDETVNFFQPNEIAIAINRVLGGVPSSLAGTLNANGQVWILNQAGIVFHQSSVTNVAGLLATTATDIDENNDEWKFLGSGYGSVLNYGEINISDGGFAIMAAPHVANAGVVKADLGQIHLAGTNTFTMDLRGDGLITFSIPEEAVQEIEAEGQALGVDNAGTLQARSGTVTMTARTASELVTGAVNLSGVIDATAFSTGKDGGSVELVSAGDINFDDGASIKVDGGVDGDGGEVVTWADGINRFKNGAEISARGGDEAGDGGFIELSGNTVRVRGDIDAAAPNGKGGEFVLDPQIITISQGNAGTHTTASVGINATTGSDSANSTEASVTVFEETIEGIAQSGVHVTLEAEDLITMEDLGIVSGTNTAATADSTLDVGSGGITLRVDGTLDGSDGLARIEFQNPNNTIVSTGGSVTVQVIGTNGAGTGAEIDIGDISVVSSSSMGTVGVNSANVSILASSGAIIAGNITVNTIINDPILAPFNVVDADANLTITAGTDITINGDINVAANYSDDTALFQIFDVDAGVNISAGSSVTINGDFNVSANAFNGTSAQIGTGDADLTANVIAGDDITITGDVSAYVDVQTVGGIGQAHSAMINVNMIAGANTAGTAATNSGTMTISGNVNAYGHVFVANPGARAVTSASVNLAAGNDINILGTTDTADGLAGIQVSALAENGNAPADSPGRVDVDAYLTMVAGAAGSSGSINIDANVDVLAQGTMDGAFRAPAFADAYANLTAADDILIDNNLRVQALTDLTELDTGTTGGFGSAHATLLASAGTVAGTAASSADTGGIVVGGLTEVIASNQKNIGVGTPLAVAFADLDAGDDISLNNGIHVYAINTVTSASFNANDFNGATATATLNIQAGNGGDADPVGRIDINDGVEVLANNQIYGTAASTVNVIADAYATINAPAAVDIGGSSNYGGITVQALANNQISGSGSHTAKAYADLDIAVGSGDIYGPVLVSASANINSGSGGFASAVANASHTDQGDITIHDYGITVSAVSNIGSGAVNAGGFASANLSLLAGSTATGNVVVEGDVIVEADVENNASGGTDADAYATLSIYAGGSAASTNGYIRIDGDVETIAYASVPNLLATSVTINASANAILYAANDIDINGGTNTADTALYVTADAFLGGSASVGIASANANLIVSAGNYVGTSVSGSVDIDGGVLVDADATASSALAGVLYANARAYAYLDAYNDLDIDGDFIVTGSANLPSNNFAGSAYAYGRAIANIYVGSDVYVGDNVTVQAVANNSAFASNSGFVPDAVALAYLNVDAGVGSNIIGYININGDLNVTADATLANNTGFSNSVIAVAYGDLESRREDITITGDATVVADAQQLAARGAAAIAYAELDMEAGFNAMNSYNLNIGGDVSVIATANNASVDSAGGFAYAQAYGNLQAAGNVNIAGGTSTADTALKVAANADAFASFAGTGSTAYALAVSQLFVGAGNNGSSGTVDIDGGVLVSGNAYFDGGPSAAPYGYVGAFGLANTLITAYNDIDISGPLTVAGSATITPNVGTNDFFGLVAKGAIGYANADLYAGNNIDVGGVSVTGYAHAYGELSTARNYAGYAYALAYLDMYAGTNGPGNLTVNGNVVVSADADFTGTYASYFGFPGNYGYTYVGAVADADLNAFNDITVNGNINVQGYADGEVFARPPFPTGFYGFASASANLEIHAGTGSPSATTASTVGFGDFTATGSVTVDAEARINRGLSYGLFVYANALASTDIYAYRDLSIDGGLNVEGDAYIGSSVVAVNAFAYGRANANLDAGRDVSIGDDLNVHAGASNTPFNAYNAGGFIPLPDAVALAYLNVDAGSGGSGSTGAILVDGDLNVTANATLDNNVGYFNAAIAVAYGDFESRRDDITITGDANVMANAQQLSLYGTNAIAYAELDLDAGFSSSGSYDLTVGGDVSVMATANNAHIYGIFNPINSGFVGGANAQAYANLQAANDVYVNGGISTADTAIKVSANADGYAYFAGYQGGIGGTAVYAYALAGAQLFVGAGNNGSSGNVDITGGVLVDADAFLDGGPYAVPYGYAGAFGLANTLITAFNDIDISGPITVAGDATVTPDVGFNPGFSYQGLIAKGAIGYANATLAAGNNIDVGSDVSVTAYAHNYGALSTSINFAGYALAGAYLEMYAGTNGPGNLTVDGSVFVSADADFTGTYASSFSFQRNFGYTYVNALSDVYLGAANDITLNGDLDVLAYADGEVFANGPPTFPGFFGLTGAINDLDIHAGLGSPSGASASSVGNGDFLATGDVTVTAEANLNRGYSLGLFNVAYGISTAYIDAHRDVSINGSLTVEADASISSSMVGLNAIGVGFANADVDAGRNVFVGDNLNVYADASNNAFAFNFNFIPGGFPPDAVALAFLNVDAGTGGAGSTGSIFVDGNLEVTAEAILTNNIGYGNAAIAVAYGDLESRRDDITITGDAMVRANAQQLAARGAAAIAYAELDMDAAFGASGDHDLTVDGDVSVMATANNASIYGTFLGLSYIGAANAQAYANLQAANDVFVNGGSNTADTAIKVSADADGFANYAGYHGGIGGTAVYAYAYADARLYVDAGNNGSSGTVDIDGGVLVDADAFMDGGPLAVPYGYAGAFGLADAQITAFNDIYINGPLTVTGNATVTPNVGTSAPFGLIAKGAIGYANAYLNAGNDIYVDSNVSVTAYAHNYGGLSTQINFAGYAYAVAYLEMYAGTSGSPGPGNITVNGNTLVSADAEIDGTYASMGFPANFGFTYAGAVADAYLNAYNDISLYGTVDVLAHAGAEIYANPSFYGVATATAELDIHAGTGSSGATGAVYITGAVTASAEAFADYGAIASFANAFAYSDVYITAGDDITIIGDVSVLANAYAEFGTFARASADLMVAAGTHSNGSLYMEFTSVDVYGYAYAGNGSVEVDVSAYFSAADDIELYGEFLTVTAPVRGSDDVVADAYLYMYAGGHNSNGNLYVGINHILVSADADATNGYAHAYATASFNAADDVTIYGDDLRVLATAYSGGGNNAFATAELYMAAGLHSSGDLAVYQNYITVAAEVTYAGSTALANAYAGLTAANDISVYINDYLEVSAYAYAPNFHPADAYADLFMHAGTHGSGTPGYGNLYVDVTNSLNVEATAYSDTSIAAAYATANFRAYNDITINSDTLTVYANAESIDSNAHAGAYLEAYAGTGGTAGDLLIDVNTASVEAYASNDDSEDALAYAYVDLKAATDITVFASNFNVYAGAYNADSGVAYATTRFNAYAGYLTSTGDLYMDITTTKVTAYANMENTEDASAHAYMDLTAANDITFYGDSLTVLADAFVPSDTVHAGAYLSAYAGNKGIGDLYIDINTTRVAAYGSNDFTGSDAYAYAAVDLKAANDITVYGSNFNVYAGARNGFTGDAVANAHFDAYAGYLTSTGDLYMDITTTEVTAYAFLPGENEAFAYAYMDLTAAEDITVYGTNLTILADAYAGGSTAQAGAYLSAYAGNKGTGDLYMDIDTTRVAAYSTNDTDDAYAYAYVDLKAANDITVYGSNFNVYAGAYNSSDSPAVAVARFDAYAGYLTSTGDLYMDITDTKVTAYAFVDSDATASAHAYMNLTAAEDITFYGTTLTVLADAYVGSNASVLAGAYLSAYAGNKGTGDLYMDITTTRVAAYASNSDTPDAYAYAYVDLKAANDITIYGSNFNVYAGAYDSNSGDAVANARFNAYAGYLTSTGDLYMDITTTEITAYAFVDDSNEAFAYAYMDLTAAEDITVYGTNLTILADAYAGGSTAQAIASLSAYAGNKGTGDLYMDIDTTRVAAYATKIDDNDSVYAEAYVDLKAANDITVYGSNFTVYAGATNSNDGYAFAYAGFEAYAGYMTATGDLYFDITTTEVTANTFEDGSDYGYAYAYMGLRADDNITVYGTNLSVLADAEVDDSDANAYATLYMAAGTGSMGDLYVDVTTTDIRALADVGSDNDAYAYAEAIFTAANDVTFYGSSLTVYAGADVGDSNGDADAYAYLIMAAGIHSASGDLYVDVTTTDIRAYANASQDEAHAYAYAALSAWDDVTFYGDSLAVYADAISRDDDDARAFATLYMEAGTGGTGDLYLDITTTLVSASASVDTEDDAYAFATVIARAANDVTIYGDTLTVRGRADINNFADGDTAIADADLAIYAGTGVAGTGSIYIDNNTTLISADADAEDSVDVYADAKAYLNAANDIRLYGEFTVNAEADMTTDGVAYAGAYMYVNAGTGAAGGNLYINNNNTLVSAYALNDGDAHAYAIAYADLNAGNDIYITSTLDVDAYAFGSDSNSEGGADAYAYLHINAGTGGTAGYLGLDGEINVDATAIHQSASDDNNVSAVAYAELTAFGDMYINGDVNVTGLASATASDVGEDIDATTYVNLFMNAGTGGAGDLTMNGNADVRATSYILNGNANAEAYAYAEFTAANDINFTGNIDVIAESDDFNSTEQGVAYAGLVMEAGTGSASGDLNVTGDMTVSADAFRGPPTSGSAYGDGNANAYAYADLSAWDDVDITGNITVRATAIGSIDNATQDLDATADAYLLIEAGTGGTGTLTLNGDTLVSIFASIDGGVANASGTAAASFFAADDIDITGDVEVIADMNDANETETAFASANFFASAGTAGTGTFTINGNILVSADAVFTGPSASTGTGGASAFADLDIIAATDIDINGGIQVLANADVTSTASLGFAIASANAFLGAGSDIDVSNTVTVMADANNSAGISGGNTGDATATAIFTASASNINMDGVTVSADAVCSGNTGSCNPSAMATGLFTAANDINLSGGTINVLATATANSTGTTANATADLDILAGGDITVGNVNAVGSAFINHSGVAAMAIASGNANIQASSSVTLNGDVTASGNASNAGSSGSATGSAFVTIGAAGGDILINGGILANVGLTSPGGTAGYALGSLQAAGSNIAGPGFQTPTATAGGASVTNIMTDTETVANSTATLIINPTIVTGDNELTRRIALTWLEATGRVLPTSLELFNGTAVIQTGTPIQTFYNLPNGNGPGGFTVDENGNLIFRPSLNGLPVGLPFPYQLYELCSGEKKVVNCPWEDEPLFY